MSFQQLKKKSEGFTIIEVLIVLAIAGLIMLIVFLAVPALNRNAHNTQRKNDVAAITGALSEYATNNNGKLPTDNATFYTASQGAKNGFYTAPTSATALGDYVFAASSNAGVTVDTSKVYVNTGAKCNTNNNNFGGSSPSSRSIAVLYSVETGGGTPQTICQES